MENVTFEQLKIEQQQLSDMVRQAQANAQQAEVQFQRYIGALDAVNRLIQTFCTPKPEPKKRPKKAPQKPLEVPPVTQIIDNAIATLKG